MNKQEEKIDRFQRVAQKRVDNLVDSIRKLGSCANKASYVYTDTQVNTIFAGIDEMLGDVKKKFNYKDEE